MSHFTSKEELQARKKIIRKLEISPSPNQKVRNKKTQTKKIGNGNLAVK
jgi:hypothetical protein